MFHLGGKDDELVKVAPSLDLVSDWSGFLSLSSEDEPALLHRHERIGQPLGAEGFAGILEQTLGRVLQPQKPESRKDKNRIDLWTTITLC